MLRCDHSSVQCPPDLSVTYMHWHALRVRSPTQQWTPITTYVDMYTAISDTAYFGLPKFFLVLPTFGPLVSIGQLCWREPSCYVSVLLFILFI